MVRSWLKNCSSEKFSMSTSPVLLVFMCHVTALTGMSSAKMKPRIHIPQTIPTQMN